MASSKIAVKKVLLTPDQQFALDMEKLRKQFDHKNVDGRYKAALQAIRRLESDITDMTQLNDTVSTYTIQAHKSAATQCTAVAIASDWHVEERVDPLAVDNTNSYSMAIAKQRSEAFFCNTLKLVSKEQQDARIDTLVLALLGDFISSNIHDELMETCEVPPVEAAMFAQNLIASGIEYLLAKSKLSLIIPCCVGNHSRITHKVHVATEHGNSLEWMIYNNLAKYFAGNKRVTFVLSKSYFTWVNVYGYDLRFHHGHAMRYNGGVGGLTVPVLRAIARYDLDRKAYLDIFGHFHHPLDGGKFICNGSLIGDTPYGKRIGFSGKPVQQFFLIQKGYGKTGVFPVFVG